MVARKAKSRQTDRPPKLPDDPVQAPRPRRVPDETRFDWSSEEHATTHGFTVFQIEDAFADPAYKKAPQLTENRDGTVYATDGRRAIFAQVKPNGPHMHILYSILGGKIKPFHARPLTATELRFYKRR